MQNLFQPTIPTNHSNQPFQPTIPTDQFNQPINPTERMITLAQELLQHASNLQNLAEAADAAAAVAAPGLSAGVCNEL